MRAAHRRIGVFWAWGSVGGGGSAYRRIGALSFSGRPAAHRRIGVFWAWGVVGAAYYRFWGNERRIGVSAYSGPGGRGGWGGSVYRRMGVFWAWGVGGGGSAYRRVGAAHRRIGVFWAWRGVREEIGVLAYRRILDLRGRWVGGVGAIGVTAFFAPLCMHAGGLVVVVVVVFVVVVVVVVVVVLVVVLVVVGNEGDGLSNECRTDYIHYTPVLTDRPHARGAREGGREGGRERGESEREREREPEAEGEGEGEGGREQETQMGWEPARRRVASRAVRVAVLSLICRCTLEPATLTVSCNLSLFQATAALSSEAVCTVRKPGQAHTNWRFPRAGGRSSDKRGARPSTPEEEEKQQEEETSLWLLWLGLSNVS